MSNRLFPVPQCFQRQRRINQRIAFAALVADLADDDQLLSVKLDGLARLAQAPVGQAR